MVKTSAQPYKHVIHANVYNHMQRTACHAGQRQQQGLAQGGKQPETDSAKCSNSPIRSGKTSQALTRWRHQAHI